jgi:hypothetical protein
MLHVRQDDVLMWTINCKLGDPMCCDVCRRTLGSCRRTLQPRAHCAAQQPLRSDEGGPMTYTDGGMVVLEMGSNLLPTVAVVLQEGLQLARGLWGRQLHW